jgi:hypothetical protein
MPPCTRIVGVILLVTMPVMAPFGESVGVPRFIWESLVGVTVFVGLCLLFRTGRSDDSKGGGKIGKKK